jgi:hypothetical protein
MASHIERRNSWPRAMAARGACAAGKTGAARQLALLPATVKVRKFGPTSAFLAGLQELAGASAAIALYELSWLLWPTCQNAR